MQLDATYKTLLRGLLDLRLKFTRRRSSRDYTDEQPLRSELLSADQMEQYGKTLAGTHRLMSGRGGNQLLARLAVNEGILIDVCNLLTESVTAKRRITPAAEWLLDNFYLIEEQIRTAKRHFPKGYSRELPCLARGSSAGLPRVYDLALKTISHGDGRVDPKSLRRFVAAYQSVTCLKLGELWAIPIMLRLAVIENLRRVAMRIAAGMIDRNLAGTWADQMIQIAERDPKNLILVIADMARSSPPMTTQFVSEFVRRLQGQSAALALPLSWMERLLSESHQTIEQLVQLETQKQAASQVSISNSIASLRFLGAMNWREFVESMSLVEQTLREDPEGVYGRMDFATRDHYRHVVEKIAKRGKLSECEVAAAAIALAQESALGSSGKGAGKPAGARAAHVGFYLIDKGLPLLERAAQVRASTFDGLRRSGAQMPLFAYLGAIASITALLGGVLLKQAVVSGGPDWLLVLVGVSLLLSVSQLAVALTNWLATLLVATRALPRLDFSHGIAADARTLVVIPTMLANAPGIEQLVEALEVRFLANRDENLRFGLLTDFADAAEETLAGDEALLQLVEQQIGALNEKYLDAGGDNFFLFHRPRRWNAREGIWMGFERKRGKLADLNALLRGGAEDRFSRLAGSMARLNDVRYVITLDTDTQLPRDSARQFAATMAHPLNRATWDDRLQRVVDGYGILQPRVAISLPRSSQSRYARVFGSEPGIDPYTRAVSDVYQDLFGEGSFIGKGIYDVDAFERALHGRLPENRILSHDLLEGCYARAALLSDVQLYEEYPSRYSADVSRRHRWIRGDWQIASWLLRRVPGSRAGTDARGRQNPLSALSQWKIFDNLRRSLVPAALVSLLILGWALLSPAWLWTLVVVGVIALAPLLATVVALFRKSDDALLGQHLATTLRSLGQQFAQAVFALACLPYEAYFSLGAIARTHWRILVARKRLLEWTPSGSSAGGDGGNGLIASFLAMWIAPATAVTTAAYLAAFRPAALVIAAPILLLWLAAPAIAWWIGLPQPRREPKLTREQLIFLRKTSRKTWAFFETFVGAQDHWLPPDNYQEFPAGVVAHRTSPTNMGLALLANLSAYDFGYLAAGPLVERTRNAFATMSGLARHRGHFYNWYDTLSLQPLSPLYVSSVDSGNLAGHLLTLRSGLLALPDQSIVGAKLFDGLLDTWRVLLDAVAKLPSAPRQQLDQLGQDLASACTSPPATLTASYAWLLRMAVAANEIAGMAALVPIGPVTAEGDPQWWARALGQQCTSARDELTLFAPWLAPAAVPAGLREILDTTGIPTLREIASATPSWQSAIAQLLPTAVPEENAWLDALPAHLNAARGAAVARIGEIERLAAVAGEMATMQYDFLYDKSRHLLAIGYNVSDRRQDASFYDMLGSEARLCSFVAIAQGQLPQESWFALGRLLTPTGGEPALLSWSGSMFEYLMPLLVMPTFENTLLDSTYHATVARQIAYGTQRGVAWGISESGYNTVDAALNYQYRAFGVPGLGLKRGLADDLVVTPYASALALMVAPLKACLNLQRLAAEGLAGQYGFYEAVDYTPARLPRGQTSVVIRSFMAHHQGMVLLSLAYLLLDRPMQKRFESDPMFQATALLLQERVPKAGAVQLLTARFSATPTHADGQHTPVRVIASPSTPTPEVQLLSNSNYHVMVTNAGGGYSRWKDLAVTRWREDTTCDNWGMFCYIRDLASGSYWSNTHQPTLQRGESYEAIFSEGRAEFRRRDLDYRTHTEIVVSPEDDIELRRVRITNSARFRRTIDVTSYAEVVLATPAADALHPAFSNLFVQTEIIAPRRAIVCTRRPRTQNEQTPWMFHLVAVHGAAVAEVSYETDRMQFIGRGRSAVAPRAMQEGVALSGSQGSVLDPVVAIRYRIALEPEQSVTVDMVSGIGDTRAAALSLIEKYQDRRLADRVFELAWTHSQVVLRQINATEADAQIYSQLANAVIYANSSLRADAGVLLKNRRAQSGLWGYAISGDLPIVLLQIGDPNNIDLVRQLVQTHAYWRLKGLVVDLVIWNEDRGGYRQLLQEQIIGLIAAGIEAHVIDRPGGIFVRSAEHISIEDRNLFESVARAIVSDQRGALADQINRRGPTELHAQHLNLARLKPTRPHRAELAATASSSSPRPRNDLLFDNGLGGFSPDGREYLIATSPTQATPAPWVNVLANPHFGCVISENGMAYTWSENAHEYRLTPWHNDPVSDTSGEAFYLRDEESGHFWSPTPLPCGSATGYVSRHGFGYSAFEHVEAGIHSELTVYVALEDAVKFSVLKVRNDSGRARRLSATGYVEWVLGDLRSKSGMHVITEIDPLSGALCARNSFNTEFADRVAFFDVDDTTRTFSGDRAEFIGRNGTLANPAAMKRSHLSNKVGAALDPCAAIQVTFELADGEESEIIFRLGAGRNPNDARKMLQRCQGSAAAREAMERVHQYWRHTLGAVQVATPDASLNVLVNGWLLYQTLACRLWARSGYYQSGGAFGYRDQLQDAMALIHAKPQLVREHLLLCASRQFREGDVQHWWHPPAGRGVRTHCSDDYLWLPLATSRYVLATGDTGVLNESIRFLDGRRVNPEDDSYYDLPGQSEEAASLYTHCVRAIQHGLVFGAHGLPLIGTGDWNDGMSSVGKDGKGESVWLGFFLCEVLAQFTGIARLQGDAAFAERCLLERGKLGQNIEANAWDGGWYRRAYFDDGTPLGSMSNDECQIDSISQSWSVLSGVADAERARTAMNALDARLVRREDSIIQLLDPPFDKSNLDPGYIRGYVPGVRENGGQYTHGAIWAAMAFAVQGDVKRAWELTDIINPVNHGNSAAAIGTYKIEPYVIAADVYGVAPHTGRGGWSWYTGSAGWMYRLVVESLLGLRLDVDKLHFAPCIPPDWPGFAIHYRYRETVYRISVVQSRALDGEPIRKMSVVVDGVLRADAAVTLVDDRREHAVEVRVQVA